MRKVDAKTYQPVEQAESMEVTVSRPQPKTVIAAVLVFVALCVVFWVARSRTRS